MEKYDYPQDIGAATPRTFSTIFEGLEVLSKQLEDIEQRTGTCAGKLAGIGIDHRKENPDTSKLAPVRSIIEDLQYRLGQISYIVRNISGNISNIEGTIQ